MDEFIIIKNLSLAPEEKNTEAYRKFKAVFEKRKAQGLPLDILGASSGARANAQSPVLHRGERIEVADKGINGDEITPIRPSKPPSAETQGLTQYLKGFAIGTNLDDLNDISSMFSAKHASSSITPSRNLESDVHFGNLHFPPPKYQSTPILGRGFHLKFEKIKNNAVVKQKFPKFK